ncbi:hypothetical protein D5086_020454 [Populus alba]|uniref:Uncharacterized protein n=1 Tax=Populus alba TaxID=43335 RepID=A0ACC4BKQ6_POPAL
MLLASESHKQSCSSNPSSRLDTFNFKIELRLKQGTSRKGRADPHGNARNGLWNFSKPGLFPEKDHHRKVESLLRHELSCPQT